MHKWIGSLLPGYHWGEMQRQHPLTHASHQLVKLLPDENAGVKAYSTIGSTHRNWLWMSNCHFLRQDQSDTLTSNVFQLILDQVPMSMWDTVTHDAGMPTLKHSADHLHMSMVSLRPIHPSMNHCSLGLTSQSHPVSFVKISGYTFINLTSILTLISSYFYLTFTLKAE